jgi:transcriptional repressor NrdR
MHCPYCGHGDSKVVDSRDSEEAIRRRRQCLSCGERFTTYERVETAALYVAKRDGRREEFSREKLLAGLRIACAKRPLPTGSIERLVDDIETELMRQGRLEAPSSQIGEMVMERLRDLDRVAYIRFASVYRDFSEVGDFLRASEALIEEEGSRVPSAQLPLLPSEDRSPRRRGRKPRRDHR